MTLILGLDPSQKTGWAFYDPAANLSAIKCGVLKIHGEKGEFEANAAQLGPALVALLKEHGKPDFAVIERAPRQQYGGEPKKPKFMGEEQQDAPGEESGTGLQSILSTNQMAAACATILGAYRIPFETIMPVTWRKQFLGFGTRPGWGRKDWKRAVRERCGQLRISVTNDDMADAAGIAFAGKACQSFRHLEHARAA